MRRAAASWATTVQRDRTVRLVLGYAQPAPEGVEHGGGLLAGAVDRGPAVQARGEKEAGPVVGRSGCSSAVGVAAATGD